jgi:hypothetical protein
LNPTAGSALGVTGGRLHGAIEVQGHHTRLLTADPLQHEVPGDTAHSHDTLSVRAGQHARDGRHIRQSGHPQKTQNHRVAGNEIPSAKMSVAEQNLHHELEQDQTVAVDSITIEVREAPIQPCFQVEPSEECLEEYQPRAGRHGTVDLEL